MSFNNVGHLITSTITTLQHFATINHTSPHFTKLRFTTLHQITLHHTSPNYASPHFTKLHLTTLHQTTLHNTSNYTSPHFTKLRFTTLHQTTLHYFIKFSPYSKNKFLNERPVCKVASCGNTNRNAVRT